MFDKLWKTSIAAAAIMVGIAGILWSQNHRYEFNPQASSLFDSRSGDVFISVDRPDQPEEKHVVRFNLKTGSFTEITSNPDKRLSKEAQDGSLNRCRTYMQNRIAAGHRTDTETVGRFDSFLDDQVDNVSCIGKLSNIDADIAPSDRKLAAEFCAFYLQPSHTSRGARMEAACQKLAPAGSLN